MIILKVRTATILLQRGLNSRNLAEATIYHQDPWTMPPVSRLIYSFQSIFTKIIPAANTLHRDTILSRVLKRTYPMWLRGYYENEKELRILFGGKI